MPSHSSLPTPAFDYIRCPFNQYTFKVKSILEWVEGQCEGTVLNLFSGMTKLAVKEVRNDLDENAPADYHQDALLFLEQGKDLLLILFSMIHLLASGRVWNFMRDEL